jgi:hypothetical protein
MLGTSANCTAGLVCTLQSVASRCSITIDSLADTIRTRFRAAKESGSQEAAGPQSSPMLTNIASHILFMTTKCISSRVTEQVDGALRALRMLSEQTHLMDCTSESVTEGVHVEVTSTFLQVP